MRSKRYHVIFDAQNLSSDKLKRSFVKRLLEELPDIIGMKILKGPLIASGTPKNPGLSGFVIIDYSHISIHTFSNNSEALIDIFSCKTYNKNKVFGFLMKEFAAPKNSIKARTVSWG